MRTLECHALMCRRQKTAGPTRRPAAWCATAVRQHNKRRQRLGNRAQPVAQPTAKRRESLTGKPLRQTGWRGLPVSAYIDRMTVNSSATLARCGNSSETHRPPCPCRGTPSRFPDTTDLAEKRVDVFDARRLAVVPGQVRLVVKRINLAQTAHETNVDATPSRGRDAAAPRAGSSSRSLPAPALPS